MSALEHGIRSRSVRHMLDLVGAEDVVERERRLRVYTGTVQSVDQPYADVIVGRDQDSAAASFTLKDVLLWGGQDLAVGNEVGILYDESTGDYWILGPVPQETGGGSGGTPPTTYSFLGLTDTPDTYTAQGGKLVSVNVAASALIFPSVLIDASNHLYPGNDNTQNLGSTTASWQNCYIGTTLFLGTAEDTQITRGAANRVDIGASGNTDSALIWGGLSVGGTGATPVVSAIILNNPTAVVTVAAGDFLLGGATSQWQFDESARRFYVKDNATGQSFYEFLSTGASLAALQFNILTAAGTDNATYDFGRITNTSSTTKGIRLFRMDGTGTVDVNLRPGNDNQFRYPMKVGALSAPTSGYDLDVANAALVGTNLKVTTSLGLNEDASGTAGQHSATGAAAATLLLAFQVTGDSSRRFTIGADGVLAWGNGSDSPADTNLYRSGASALKTDDALMVSLALGVGVAAAATTGTAYINIGLGVGVTPPTSAGRAQFNNSIGVGVAPAATAGSIYANTSVSAGVAPSATAGVMTASVRFEPDTDNGADLGSSSLYFTFAYVNQVAFRGSALSSITSKNLGWDTDNIPTLSFDVGSGWPSDAKVTNLAVDVGGTFAHLIAV